MSIKTLKSTLYLRSVRLKRRWYWLTYRLSNIRVIRAWIQALRRSQKVRRVSVGFVCLILASCILLSGFLTSSASAKTINLTSADMLAGTTDFNQVQLNATNTAISLQRGNIGQWTGGDGLQLLPTMVYNDSNFVYGPGNTMYYMTFFTGCRFFKYDMELQTWSELATPNIGCAAGAVLVSNGTNALYYMPGGGSNTLFKYTIDTNTWSRLADMPAIVNTGGSGAYVPGGSPSLYIARGNASASLYKYDINGNTWEAKAPFPATQGSDQGVAIAYDGAGNIYGSTNHHGEFKRYSIVGDSWASLTTQPNAVNYRLSLFAVGGKVYSIKNRWNSSNPLGGLQVYDVNTNTWSNLTSPPNSNSRGFRPPLAYDGTNLYTLGGNDQRPMMYKYAIGSDTWVGLPSTMAAMNSAGGYSHQQLIYDGGQHAYYVGATGAGSYNGLYDYNLSTGSVSQISSQLGTTTGSVGVYKNGALYLLGSSDLSFQKYDLTSNSWITLADMPATINDATAIVDGNNGYLYANFGNTLYRYSEATGWAKMANSPSTGSSGGGLARVGDKLYGLVGNNSGLLQIYDIGANTWTSAYIPRGSVNGGGFLTSDRTRYLYANLGTYTDPANRHMFRYDTTTASWSRIADLPQSTLPSGANGFYDATNSRLYVNQGNISSHLWYWTATTASFQTTGNWYSKVIDAKNVQSWQGLQYSSPGTGTVTAYTRTSAGGGLWTNWQAVTNNTINSPANRYLQIKFTLAGNGTATPSISNIAVNYSQDATAPNLPSQFQAKATNSQSAQTLVSGQTYAHQHPYFSWSGATDNTGGSGVAGYNVYFGTDSSADPAVDGNYQTTTGYTVTTPMTASEIYYLRISVKDNLGNTSPIATYFSYRYFYISPPGSVMESSASDFSSGVNTGVAIDNNGMRLVQKSAGAWSTGPVEPTPAPGYGSAMAVVKDSIYAMRGKATSDFWKYDTVSQSWTTLASLPVVANIGSALSWDGGNYLYAIAGGSTNGFYVYDITNNVWAQLPNLPVSAVQGTDMTYVGNGNFAIIFANVSEYYFYNSSTRAYTAKTSAPLVISGNAGSGIWYDGNDTIYTYFGVYDQWQPNRRSLAAYSISQDTWRSMSIPPFDAIYAQNNLVGDNNGHLYIFSNDFASNQNQQNAALRYNIATDDWDVLPEAQTFNVRGSSVSDGKRYIYIIPSENNSDNRRIIRYDTWNRTMTPNTPVIGSYQRIPASLQNAWAWVAGSATTMAYDGTENIYAIGADEGNWSEFVQYNLASKKTNYLTPPPYVGMNGSLAFSNGYLYYVPANNTNRFYRYNFSNASWDAMTNLPGNVYRPGAGGLQANADGTLYVAAGNNRNFYKYTPDSGTGSWTSLAQPAANILYGAMTNNGSGMIYVLGGNNTANFWRYDTSSNTWSTLANLPVTTTNGGATLTYKNGKIYATAGNTRTNAYVYDVASNSWQTGTNTPEAFRVGAAVVDLGNQALAIAGDNGPDLWYFQYPGTNTAYNGQATHISTPFSMEGLFDYAGIQAQVNTPANTSVEFWTRTSADGATWSDWSITDQVKNYNGSQSMRVTSTPQKYIQVKTILYSFDNMYTPTVSNYSLSYYYDITPPNNPTLLSVYKDSSKTTEFAHNTWYNTASPYITWPEPGETGGATDGPLGSNIKGYWVYVGTDATAVPQTAGVFVPTTSYTPTLTTAGRYYIRIQAVDMTGNVDPSVFAPFTYRFDATPPTNPALITVTPSGFTSINKYTFQWPAAYDGDSGITGYCYHTGALTGPLAVETCQPDLSLVDLEAAYQPGTNVMYLRTIDSAGNYSNGYTSVSYYYSVDPPSAVTNLRAVPPTSTQNLFAFTWDLPLNYSGDPNQLSYCYSINVLPSALNTTCTSERFLAPFKAATQQGTNIIYVVAKDESGRVSWTNFASGNFIANTVSPGIPLNLTASDTSDQSSGRFSITLTWDAPTFVGNGVAGYVVQRSTDGHAYSDIGSGSNKAYVDLDVIPGQEYYYRVIAQDNVGNRGGASNVVIHSAIGNYSTPPAIVSAPTVSTSFDQTTVSWVTSRESTSFVYYGTSPTNLNQSTGTLELSSVHKQVVSGLQPSTTYYYKVQSFDNERDYNLNEAFSQLGTFTTTAAAQIFNVTISDVSLNSAVIRWQTSVPTTSSIKYGTDLGYGFSEDDGSGLTTNHTFVLGSLASGTEYHFRVHARTEGGSTIKSDDYRLETLPRPSVSNVRFQPIDDAANLSVKVSWDTNVPTSSSVVYTALGQQKEEATAALVTKHEIIINDLASSTDYNMNISGRDQYGNLTTANSQTWRSQVDTRAPSISGLSVTASTTDAINGAKAQLIVTWKTDEPSTTQLAYSTAGGKKLVKKSNLDPEPTTQHVVVLSGLQLSSVFRVQPISQDISGNKTFGRQLATVTPDQQQSVLDNVLTVLQKVFRL